MKTITSTLKLGDETFRLRWDMGAIATFEQLTGENALVGITVNARNILALLWAALDADAAAREQDAPISFRKFGSLLDTDEKQAHAMRVAAELLQLNAPDVEEAKKVDPPTAPASSRSRSRGATRSARSTSASPSASSGG